MRWRRRPQLGPAVTGLPSGPLRTSLVPPQRKPLSGGPVVGEVPAAPVLRVVLGMRDGSLVEMHREAEQFGPLQALAAVLVAPD